jgi:hypothetical protein
MTAPAQSIAYIGSFEAVAEIMFGPRQHDKHVRAYRAHQFYADQKVRLRLADEAVRAECARMSEETAQQLARTNGYDTAALRRMFDQYATGCFSKNWNASAVRRIALRALDIAIEHQAGAFATAAE